MYYDADALECLRSHGLYITKNRILTLEVLLKTERAMSVAEIIRISPGALDRVSVHRALHTLIEKKLVCVVPNKKGEIRYMLERTAPAPGSTHCPGYFICSECGTTMQLFPVTFPEIRIPAGAGIRKLELVIEGWCTSCNHKEAKK